ncbi:MAG TPA: vanadium-dependent haloperoxidase [Solirubrobacteraceae bacterium]|nr:vanadium-dependent haloperoxidase [Solirubrobacteraceae bacterium]
MRSRLAILLVLIGAVALAVPAPGVGAPPQTQCAPAGALPAATSPVAFWSTEARCAIVPMAAGPENFGSKFPGEAAVYMGIVHAAIYDAAVAVKGGYEPYAVALSARRASPEAAVATAAHHTLVGPPGTGLQPALGLTPAQQAILDGDYAAYIGAIPDGKAKVRGIAVGAQVAAAILALRTNDGREANPQLGQPPFVAPPPGPGVWERNPGNPPPPVLGLRLPGIRPLALRSASQFRPDGPEPLTSPEYAKDFRQVKELGRSDSLARTPEQTTQALFWTDHDLRQWNDGMLRLAADHGLDLVQTARMLAMAHVAGGDAMIACFDAKYHYWFWRPWQAIPQAAGDGNPATEPDPGWQPLRPTPNFPEYPSAHACHTTATAEALRAFFGTDRVPLTLDSRVTQTSRAYDRLREVVGDVDQARVLAGFHFWSSDLEGSRLGRDVGRYVVVHLFRSAEAGCRPAIPEADD